jgi:molybdopterin-containing oxidoreductase family membrane subunit
MAEILGILTEPHATVGAVEKLKEAGFSDLEVYSPIHSHEIEHAMDRGPSRVRLWTLIGGLTGVTAGYSFTIWTSYDWPLVVGGKPFASIPAYTVIGFELTILFGGILTVLGLIVHGMIRAARRGGPAVYRPSFSSDEFGCLVRCHQDQIPRVQEILNGAGCTEVRVVQG